MPYLAGSAGFNLNRAPSFWDQIKASLLFRPIAGTVPSGIVTVGAITGTAQTYTNVTSVLWNSGQFNSQGQRWVAVDGTPSNGCKNVATERLSGGVTQNHVTAFEFLHTGGNLDIEFIGAAYHDVQVYLDLPGTSRMYRATAAPVTGTTTGRRYLPLTFPAAYHGRVRVHLGGGLLVGIKCEQSAIVKKAPDRIFAVLDGDILADGLGIKQASGTSYLVGGLVQYLFELTGIVFAPRGMPSGMFYNGSATVTDDTAATDGSTRWFSAARKAYLEDDFTDKPLFYLLIGTTDDGGRSGATGSPTGTMATRAKACYDWIRGKDRYVTIVHVSPSPFTGAGAAGTVTGPPTADSSHDFNRREQTSALATLENTVYVNAFGPGAPWWIGTGSNGTPNTSQQATLIGADGVNPNDVGMRFLASKIAIALGQILVDALRARRQR